MLIYILLLAKVNCAKQLLFIFIMNQMFPPHMILFILVKSKTSPYFLLDYFCYKLYSKGHTTE